MGKRYTDEEIINALLETGSSKAAARRLGCSAITIRKRKQDNEFAQKFQIAKDELLGETVSRLRAAARTAVDTLEEIAKDRENNAQSRANASNYILSHTSKYLEIADFAERLSKLEAEMQEQKRYEDNRY